MSSKSQSRVARPMDRSEIERQELAGAIRRAVPRDGRVEMQPGITLFRVSTPTEPVYGVSESFIMRHLTTIGGHAHRVVRAVKKLREDFAKPLRIEDVAREIGMSVSGFHAHFKAVTAMSPLQFQKRLRLQEARRLMLTESLDAAEAGFQVGYDDASHFSREYKRHFGDPPLRDIQGLRELTLVSEAG